MSIVTEFSGGNRSKKNMKVAKLLNENSENINYRILGYEEVPLRLLRIDLSYQREPSPSKVKEIAAGWNDVAAGVIIVSKRNDGFYVVDGGHRFTSKMRLAPNGTFVCMLAEFGSVEDEAKAFALLNSNRKPMSSAARVKALHKIGEPAARLVYDLIHSAGREPSDKSSNYKLVGCVGTMHGWAISDPDALMRVWDLYLPICGDQVVHGDVISGLCKLESTAAVDGVTICGERHAKRWQKLGYQTLTAATKAGIAHAGKGGEKVYAWGLQREFNRGQRDASRLELIKLAA